MGRETGPTAEEWPLLDVLRGHVWRSDVDGDLRVGDPGWHACSCGLQGYWSDFHPHLAAELAVVVGWGVDEAGRADLRARLRQRSSALNRTSAANEALREQLVALGVEPVGVEGG